MKPRVILALVVVMMVIFLAYRYALRRDIYLFAYTSGPDTPTFLVARQPAQTVDYAAGSDNRLAILVTDPASAWLGLARGLRAHGIPFVMTTNIDAALKHRAVYVYPMISGRTLDAAAFDKLRSHVQAGGGVMAYDVEGGGLQDMFGIAGPPQPNQANELYWTHKGGIAEDDVIRISNTGTEAELASLAYVANGGETDARYGNDKAAMVCKRAAGVACVLGVDLGALSQRALNGRLEGVARSYVNGYEPSLDVLYNRLSDFYVNAEPMPYLVDTAASGYDLTILLSHDIDFTRAIASADEYAHKIAKAGAKATFFMQTKYIRDYNDDVFFTNEALLPLHEITGLGMEIGSHSVSHSRQFKQFPMGTGLENYPNYLPYISALNYTANGTIMGELRISKYLLKSKAGVSVTSFRAGYLSNPFALPQALTANAFAYDSSITANSCLTFLPYQLTTDRGDTALEPAYEFPVTIEDEDGEPMDKRFNAASIVVDKIARHHGLAVIQVHPDTTSSKLEFELRLIAKWKGRAWFPTVSEFGDWWRARDQADIDVKPEGSGWTMTFSAKVPLHNLKVSLPKLASYHLVPVPGASFANGQLVITDLSGATQLHWTR